MASNEIDELVAPNFFPSFSITDISNLYLNQKHQKVIWLSKKDPFKTLVINNQLNSSENKVSSFSPDKLKIVNDIESNMNRTVLESILYPNQAVTSTLEMQNLPGELITAADQNNISDNIENQDNYIHSSINTLGEISNSGIYFH